MVEDTTSSGPTMAVECIISNYVSEKSKYISEDNKLGIYDMVTLHQVWAKTTIYHQKTAIGCAIISELVGRTAWIVHGGHQFLEQ